MRRGPAEEDVLSERESLAGIAAVQDQPDRIFALPRWQRVRAQKLWAGAVVTLASGAAERELRPGLCTSHVEGSELSCTRPRRKLDERRPMCAGKLI